MASQYLLLSLCFCPALAAEPVPVYSAKQYMTTMGTHPNGVLQLVKAPDAQDLPVLHLKGSASERGEAYGTLMAETIAEFVTKVFDDYVVALLESVDLNGLPKWLQTAIKAALGDLGRKVANPLLQKVLTYVQSRQNATIHAAHDSTTKVFDELAGIARGVCNKLGADRCQSELGGEEAFRDRLERVNYLPELIRMSCSMLGATQSATMHGKLLQMRTLDFGAVPFSNYGMVVVHHKSDEHGKPMPNAFAVVTFPGFVSTITGFNSAGLIQSEKVSYDARSAGYNQTCIKPFGVDIYGCIPGSYEGEAMPFVIRRIVETARTKAAAEDLIRTAKRTWHMYLGLGDSETMDFDVVGYAQERIKVWNNSDISVLTNASHIKDVTFVDMHVQPEKDVMYDILKPLAGNMTGHLISSYVPHATGSGDVHHMVVDHGEGMFYVAVGTTTANGTYFLRKACDAPVVSFNLADDVWKFPKKAEDEVVV